MNDLTPIRKQLAARLKAYRLEREWTLEHLSAITGMAASTLSRIENGHVTPSDLTAHRIMKTLPGILGEAA